MALVSGAAVAGAFTLTARSDCVWASSVAVAELLLELGSADVVVTVAVLAMDVLHGTLALSLTVILNTPGSSVASAGFVQVMVPVVPTPGVVQVQPAACTKDWKVTLASKVSVRVTVLAVTGPPLETLIV